MYTTMTASSRFKIYAAVALAALLMTLLAVTLATSTAQATEPRHATPEACPGETGNTNTQAASVVDSGHYALFDVYWNPDEGELTNTVCPPSVEYVSGSFPNPDRTDRSPSGINITADPPTIIHIPSSHQINLSDNTTYDNTTYEVMYSEVKGADDLEDRNADGVAGDGDGIVWALPACPPDGSASEGDLCLSFSAALLEQADWANEDETRGGKVTFHVDHVHQTDIDKQDPRYVLVYDVPPTGAEPNAALPLWNSSDLRESKVLVAPGGYNRPLWFFTDRGTYEFQVHIQGNPDQTKADSADLMAWTL